MKKLLEFLLITLWLTSCKSCKQTPPESLCSEPLIYENNDLRIDGYYYRPFNDAEGRREVYFFYQNGVMLYGGVHSAAELASEELGFMNGNYYESVKSDVIYWGRFRVSGGWFAFDRWYPGSSKWKVYVRDGEVLSDSSLHVTKVYRCDGSETRAKDEYYYFKQLPLKPDSTNQFVP